MNRLDRRSFLGLAGRSSAAMMITGLTPYMWQQQRPPTVPTGEPPPNILLFLAGSEHLHQDVFDRGGVTFTQHYAAAGGAAAYACMLTGLYAHQHFCVVNDVSELQPGFPTFGEFLRQFGYATHWFGAWPFPQPADGAELSIYGFTAHPATDLPAAPQTAAWLTEQPAASDEPWCAVVNLDAAAGAAPQLAAVMTALETAPAVIQNTVVIVTGDRCERDAALPQDEACRAPLIVRDFSGKLRARPGQRRQLTSHVDLAALLLTIAYGGDGWRTLHECAHLANRLDMLAIVRDPDASGRPYVVHTADEPRRLAATGAPGRRRGPFHAISYQTAAGRFTCRCHWRENSTAILTEGQQTTCYALAAQDWAAPVRAAPVRAGDALYTQLQQGLEEDALYAELRAPLPYALTPAQVEARGAYLAYLSQQG